MFTFLEMPVIPDDVVEIDYYFGQLSTKQKIIYIAIIIIIVLIKLYIDCKNNHKMY